MRWNMDPLVFDAFVRLYIRKLREDALREQDPSHYEERIEMLDVTHKMNMKIENKMWTLKTTIEKAHYSYLHEGSFYQLDYEKEVMKVKKQAKEFLELVENYRL